MLDLYGDKNKKCEFLNSLIKGDYFNIEHFNLTNLGMENKDLGDILKAIESTKGDNIKSIKFTNNSIT